MDREFESNPREVGQVYLYLQVSALLFQDPQVLTGTETFGRFGSSVAHLGDLNQDGYNGNLEQCVGLAVTLRPCYRCKKEIVAIEMILNGGGWLLLLILNKF